MRAEAVQGRGWIRIERVVPNPRRPLSKDRKLPSEHDPPGPPRCFLFGTPLRHVRLQFGSAAIVCGISREPGTSRVRGFGALEEFRARGRALWARAVAGGHSVELDKLGLCREQCAEPSVRGHKVRLARSEPSLAEVSDPSGPEAGELAARSLVAELCVLQLKTVLVDRDDVLGAVVEVTRRGHWPDRGIARERGGSGVSGAMCPEVER